MNRNIVSSCGKVLLLSGGLLFSSCLFADSTSSSPMAGWYVGLGGGWVHQLDNSLQNAVLPYTQNGIVPIAPDTLINNKANGDSAAWFVEGGYQFVVPEHYFPSYRLGLSYEGSSEQSVSGTIDQNTQGVPASQLQTYGFNVSSEALLVTGEADVGTWFSFTPFLHVGVGASMNRGSGFSTSSEQDLISFDNHTQTEFAYEVGPGLGYGVGSRFSVKLTALYRDFGTASLGTGTRQNANSGPGAATTTFPGLGLTLQDVEVRLGVNYLI